MTALAAPPVDVAAVRAPRTARRRRHALVVTVLALAVLAAGLTTLSLGDLQVSLPDVLRTLAGHGTSLTDYLVGNRLPRVVAALVAGAALAVSGALFQSLLDNHLASPDILGITGGAGFATVLGSVTLGLGSLAQSGLATAGALAAAALIWALAWRGGVSGQRFVLVGVGVAFMVTAAENYLLTRADVSQAQVALAALVGGVGNADWTVDSAGALGLGVLVAALVPAARSLRALQLGPDTAHGLGVPVAAHRTLLLLAVLFAAVGVATAGPLAFVAFMSAPIARRLLRDGTPALLPAALIGALLVQLADLAGQHLIPGGTELPAGVLTGAIGAPYLLWLLATGGRVPKGSA